MANKPILLKKNGGGGSVFNPRRSLRAPYLFGCAEFSSVDTKIIFFISELTIYKKLNRYYKRRQFHQAIVHSFIYAIDRIN